MVITGNFLICNEDGNLELQMILKGDVSRTGGSSGMRQNLLEWKWDVMELREDLEWRRLLNELDDMVTSNGHLEWGEWSPGHLSTSWW